MGRRITVAGGNLFQIAALALGDATQANRLAVLNSLLDPFAIGVSTIDVPDISKAATGGLPFGPLIGGTAVVNPWSPPAPVAAPPVVIPSTPPPVAVVNAPPITDGPWLWNILSAWQPVPPTPTLTRHLPPSVAAVTVSIPVAFQRKWLDTAVQSWQPPDPLPTRPKQLPPSLVAVSPDQAPGGGSLDPQWLVLTAWQPLPPLPSLGTPKIIATGIQVSAPPPGGGTNNPVYNEIVSAWQPLAPLWTPRNVMSFSTQRVLFKNIKWLPTVLAAWQPSDGEYYRH